MRPGRRRTKLRWCGPALRELIAQSTLACLLIAAAGPLLAAPTPAAERRLQIDLAESSLQRALDRLAELTQLQILYDPQLLRGLTTRGIHGVMTPAEALHELLAPTGLVPQFTAEDAVALHREARSNTAPVVSPPPSPVQLRTITIATDRAKQDSYDASASVSSVKIDESALLVPFSSSSLTQQVLRDQQAIRLEDVVEFVSGTGIVPDGQSSLGFEIRGFPTYQYYLDDVRVSPDLHHDGFRDLANIDHIDILKGPASLLYGRTEPGGLINVVTKQPLTTPMLSLEQRAGSFDREATLLDAGGPLSSQGSFLYRFNAAWESGGSFRDIPDNRRIFLSPVLTWKAAPQMQTTAYLEYLDSRDPSDSGLPIIGDHLPQVPISRSLDEGGEIHTTDLRVGIRGSYTFADGWTLRDHLDTRWLRTPQAPQLALAADGLAPSQCVVSSCPVERQLISIPAARGYTNYASVDVSHDISTGRARHSLLAGIEFFQTEAYSHWEVTSDSTLTTDLFDPRYIPIPLSLLQNPDQETYRNARERWGAAYVQDQVALGDAFYLLVGLRFDSAWAIIGETTRIPTTQGRWTAYDAPSQAVQAIKHREGLVWHPTTSLSFYVKYTQNFAATPSLYINVNGNSGLDLPQQSATEWETGVKLELPDGRATATLAAFDLTKENISSSLLEPALDPSGIQFFTGTARNVGLEADIHGEILPGLQVLANYAYIQSRIIYDSGNSVTTTTSGNELIGSTGDRLFGVPRNGGSAWGSYRFDDGMLRGLKSGAGMVARGAREGDNANDYELPGFIKWNAFAAYDWLVRGTQMSIQLNVDNIFNARYFESVSGTRTVMPASPRRWMGSFRMQF